MMIKKMKMRSYSTFSRNNLPLPIEDFRVSPRTPWCQFLDEHKSICQIYNLICNHILSDIRGTSIADIRAILRNQYAINIYQVEDCLQFLIMNETKRICFEEKNGCRLPILFLSPRNKVEIVGEFCIWVSSDKMAVKAAQELER